LSNPETPDQPLEGVPDPAPTEATRNPISHSGVTPATPGEATPQPAPPARVPYVSREERERRKREALASLVIGEWREGKVTGIAAFGAFVDLGGVDGLVHVSQLGTGGYVERVEDVVQVGQTVRVRISEVDFDRGRVSLSMREARPAGAAPTSARPDRPAPVGGPRPVRPAGGGAAPTPAWTPETPPEHRPDRRPRGAPERGTTFARDERQPRRPERPRRGRDSEDQEWRSVRGDARGFYSFSEEEEEEPAPTTAEELVARFGRRETARE
jgi:predicted RNA-binding protein with RPS1 domain